MKPNLKDRVCSWLTKRKTGLGTVVVSAVYLALLAALLIGLTTAKYFEKRTVYTGFEGSKFNALILGEYGQVVDDQNKVSHMKSIALSEFNKTGETVKAFGDSLDATSLEPGDTKDLWFSVSNGIYPQDKDETNSADINEEYTIKLRTTGYLPLNYKMVYLADGTTETELITGDPVRVVPTGGKDTDAKWYEYSFYATAADKAAGNEKTFTLSTLASPSGLDINVYSFRFDWPIEQRNGVWTNDELYMKEVDIIECYVTVKSLATTPDSGTTYNVDGQSSSGSPSYSTDDVYQGTGLVTLHDGVSGYNYSWITRDYELDMRAITSSDSGFVLRINDGLQARRATDDSPITGVPRYTDYKIELQVPVFNGSIKADQKTEQAQSTKDVVYSILLPGETERFTRTSCSYYIYDIKDKEVVELTEEQQTALDACTTDTQALEFFSDNKFDEDSLYLYRTDVFIRPADEQEVETSVTDTETGETSIQTSTVTVNYDYLKRNTNTEYENDWETQKTITEVFNHRDDIRIYANNADATGDNETGTALDEDSIKYLAPSHKINVKVYYRFANDTVQS